MAAIRDGRRLRMLRRQVDHFIREIYAEYFSGAVLRQRDAVVARPAADVEDGPASDRRASFDGLLISESHAGPKMPVDQSIHEGIAVAVDGVEITRVGVKKL